MTTLRRVGAIAAGEIRLFVRDRSNIFFVLVFPLLLVVMIGAQFGEDASAGRAAVVGSADSALHADLVAQLEDQDVVVSHPDWDSARTQLARGRLDVAVRLDEAAVDAYVAGDPVSIEMVRGSSSSAQVVEQQVRQALDALRTTRGQQAALEAADVPTERAAAALAAAREQASPPTVEVRRTGDVAEAFEGLGRFDYGASGQLLLFTFLNTMTGATTLIAARRLGVVRRVLSTPVSPGQAIAGLTLGRWGIGMAQGVYIMVATALLFGVDWGNWGLGLLVLAVFAMVAAGVAMLIGTLLDNEGAAVGLSVGVGLVLGALGGAMFPRELFPATMKRISDLTPHGWAYEAFADLQRHDGGFTDVLPELGVLALMAALVVGLAAWTLRRSLARAM